MGSLFFFSISLSVIQIEGKTLIGCLFVIKHPFPPIAYSCLLLLHLVLEDTDWHNDLVHHT